MKLYLITRPCLNVANISHDKIFRKLSVFVQWFTFKSQTSLLRFALRKTDIPTFFFLAKSCVFPMFPCFNVMYLITKPHKQNIFISEMLHN